MLKDQDRDNLNRAINILRREAINELVQSLEKIRDELDRLVTQEFYFVAEIEAESDGEERTFTLFNVLHDGEEEDKEGEPIRLFSDEAKAYEWAFSRIKLPAVFFDNELFWLSAVKDYPRRGVELFNRLFEDTLGTIRVMKAKVGP